MVKTLPLDMLLSRDPGMAFVFAFIGLASNRLWHVGDLEGHEAGTAGSIAETPLSPVPAVEMPSAAGGLAAALPAGRRISRWNLYW